MKTLLAALFFFPILSFAAEPVLCQVPDSILLYSEELPEFPGGAESLNAYLRSNIRYPQAARDSGIQAKIRIRFVVDENGWIKNPELLKLDAWKLFGSQKIPVTAAEAQPLVDEAFRVVRLMRPWKPGKQSGRPVSVYYILPVSFVIDRPEPAIYIEQMPEFPGGMDAMKKFMKENLHYPDSALKHKVLGKVMLRFTVLEDGTVDTSRISVLSVTAFKKQRKEIVPADPAFNRQFAEEAVNLIRKFPAFSQGMQNAKPMAVYYNLTVNFD